MSGRGANVFIALFAGLRIVGRICGVAGWFRGIVETSLNAIADF